ncbi:MAG: SOS response-associated peptidase [Planctomycetia bacterium]|nr:SOS response-associated peptidase [Planctomycetia bacterium]
MCGRFTLRTPAATLIRLFELGLVPDDLAQAAPRYNIAPTQSVLAVRQARPDSAREAVWLHWGLIPNWADDPAIGNKMINARGETVHEKPSFRRAFRRQRCLVPADGYYEWQKLAGGRNKQAWLFHRGDGGPFAIAGLWEHWQSREPDGPAIESCTLITTTANRLAGKVYDRMPVILHEADYATWLNPAVEDVNRLRQLLLPLDDQSLVAEPVSSYVNKPTNDDAKCVEPVEVE